jgi:cobalt-zinc-cadmium efflux system membrane fusion protein
MRCLAVGFLSTYSLCVLAFAGCGDAKSDPNAGAPPPLNVETAQDPNVFQADRPDQFPLTTAVEHTSVSQLRVTGTVAPDISRTVPVVSLATGRVVEIAARLGDTVQKGQLLLRVQSSDIAGAFSDYQKAVADETLARSQGERAKDLFAKGAISQNDFQVAQDAAAKAEVDVKTAAEKLQVLGSTDLNKPSGIVDVRAPISGVITDQQVTNAGGIQGLGSPNPPMTISDLTHVWILCDVFENDLAIVHVGEKADVRLNAYPDKIFSGVISNVGPILDPNIRTSKVRIELSNPGIMRLGMFVTATFHGQKRITTAAVPASAVLHLHDRDWVYVPTKDKKFRRVEVKGGEMLPGGLQEITSGIVPGDTVVSNALELQNTVEQ